MNKQLDTLKCMDNEVIFIKADGEQIKMPNLTALIKLYHEADSDEMKARIEEILNQGIGSLLICEIMIDMQNETTLKRLETGEISKTMRHVGTYNIILESHIEKAKAQFEDLKAKGEVEETFEAIQFSVLPYGVVIEREKFPQYDNIEYVKEIL